MRILIVENENNITEALLVVLLKDGYAVDVSENGETALAQLLINDYDLLLLDLDLPDMSGFRICNLVKEKHPSVLILALITYVKKEDIIAGLNAGADDCLGKPFHPKELLARVRALLRRDIRTREPILKIQDVSLDASEKAVWISNQKVGLTRKEFSILEYLMRHPNEVVSQEMILEHVWGSLSNVFTNTVRVHIQSLRRKLGDSSKTPKYIETVIGFGYRFINR
jgi:DNA-binding response OmpR family regulator